LTGNHLVVKIHHLSYETLILLCPVLPYNFFNNYFHLQIFFNSCSATFVGFFLYLCVNVIHFFVSIKSWNLNKTKNSLHRLLHKQIFNWTAIFPRECELSSLQMPFIFYDNKNHQGLCKCLSHDYSGYQELHLPIQSLFIIDWIKSDRECKKEETSF